VTAWAFALTALENGRRIGHAVICADSGVLRDAAAKLDAITDTSTGTSAIVSLAARRSAAQ
jgi:hypothetical protein